MTGAPWTMNPAAETEREIINSVHRNEHLNMSSNDHHASGVGFPYLFNGSYEVFPTLASPIAPPESTAER